MLMRKEGIVIAGFVDVGKTTLAKKYNNVIYLESSTYRYNNLDLENMPVEKRRVTKRSFHKD